MERPGATRREDLGALNCEATWDVGSAGLWDPGQWTGQVDASGTTGRDDRVGGGEREDRIGCTAAWWVPAMELGAAPK